jgi:hypothetical protein
VLLDIGIEKPRFAYDLFEAGKDAVFLDLVMIDEPLGPHLGQEEQICNVLGLFDVERLQVDAIDTAQDRVVREGHVIGDGDGFMAFLIGVSQA